VCLLLPESEQDVVTEPLMDSWVLTARCALMILAECPEILFSSAAKAACECCHDYCNADRNSAGRSYQTAAPAKIQVQICHGALEPTKAFGCCKACLKTASLLSKYTSPDLLYCKAPQLSQVVKSSLRAFEILCSQLLCTINE